MINISVIQQPSPHIGFWGRPTGRSILTLGRQVGHASPQWWLRCDQAPARFGGNGHGCLKLEQKPYPFKGYECKGGAPRGGLAATAKIARQRGSSVTDDGIKLDRTPSHRQGRNAVRGARALRARKGEDSLHALPGGGHRKTGGTAASRRQRAGGMGGGRWAAVS